MKRLLKNAYAISPVVASLMLVLVAVGAASSFAIFVGERQGEIQKARMSELERSLEKLEIENVNNLNLSYKNKSMSFRVRNVHAGISKIFSMYVNGRKIETFKVYRNNATEEWWLNFSNNFYELVRVWGLNSTGDYNLIHDIYNDSIPDNRPADFCEIDSYENVNISLDNIMIPVDSNGLGGKNDLSNLADRPITIKITTSYINDFEKTFYPPISIIKIETLSDPLGGGDYIILDGSLSTCPFDAYIVSWDWDEIPQIPPPNQINICDNMKCRNDTLAQDGNLHTIRLRVTNNYGMIGESTINYQH